LKKRGDGFPSVAKGKRSFLHSLEKVWARGKQKSQRSTEKKESTKIGFTKQPNSGRRTLSGRDYWPGDKEKKKKREGKGWEPRGRKSKQLSTV